MQSILAAPNAIIVATEILLIYSKQFKYELNIDKITDTINLILLQHSNLNHTHEISWVLWLAKTLSVQLKEEIAQKISQLEDSIVALITLDINHSGLIQGNIDFELWENMIKSDYLYSRNWLLCYEANRQEYFPHTIQQRYVENDDFFACLKDKKVSFYDGLKQIEIEHIYEDEDDEYEDDYNMFLY